MQISLIQASVTPEKSISSAVSNFNTAIKLFMT
jgi:hypothetical protein